MGRRRAVGTARSKGPDPSSKGQLRVRRHREECGKARQGRVDMGTVGVS